MTDHDWDSALDERVAAAREQLAGSVAPRPPAQERSRPGRTRRRMVLTVATVLAAAGLVWVASSVLTGDAGEPVIADRPDPGPSTQNAELLEPGEVRPIAPSPLTGRSTMASVWTGSEMLVWGGESPDGPFADGAGYDPVSDTWQMLSESPLSARNAPAVVWTGDRAIFWGGHSPDADHRDGAIYDPATDTWEAISDAPMASAGGPEAVWTGEEMLVLAGLNTFDAAAYDPASDTWRKLDPLPAQLAAPFTTVQWTGAQLVARATWYSPVDPSGENRLFAYDLDSDRWMEVPSSGGVEALGTLTWTGDRLISTTQWPGADVTSYDPETRELTAIATWPSDTTGTKTAVWTGTRVLLWSGQDARLLDPATGAIDVTPAGNGPERIHPAVVWADGVLIVWGGFDAMDDGLMLRPVEPPSRSPGTTTPVTITEPGPSGDLVPVGGPDERFGYIDSDAGPIEVNGRLLQIRRVVDENGNHIAYFGCSWIDREVVESPEFDPDAICADTTVTTAEGG